MKHLEDCYVKEFAATVTGVKDGKFVTLNESYFYPKGGGQPHDEGVLKRKSDGKEFRVVFVGKFDGTVSHEIDGEGLVEGDEVEAAIDWVRRYRLMRSHTAAHVVSEVIYRETGALITGNQLSPEKVRIDFSLESFDPKAFAAYIEKANDVIAQDIEVETRVVPREEALKHPQVSKLAGGLPESINEVRIVDIKGFDIQGCGGTHVKRLSEIGKLTLLKCENKGKQNRRISFVLSD